MSDNPANLINLLPEQRQVFFTYNGSLTTPPCYEVVTWIVMSSPIHISNAKVSAQYSHFSLFYLLPLLLLLLKLLTISPNQHCDTNS